MISSSASPERPLTQAVSRAQSAVSPLSPAAESGSQANFLTRDARWLVGVCSVYVLAVVLAVLALNVYFSQTWDVVTFIGAGRIAFSSEWNALYAQSRADNYWPYAYPPLHAFVVAPFVALAGGIPDFLLVRVPPLLFDVALGILLYAVVARKTENKTLARLAILVWLLNPVTWYDTAVQGHFEAEWLFFVVLAYYLTPSPSPKTRRGENDLTPSPSPKIQRGGNDLTTGPSPRIRRGENDLASSPSPKIRRGENDLTSSPSPKIRRGENDLTTGPSPRIRRGEIPALSLLSRGGWLLATLALSVAFLFKQNAILFALPLWAMLFFGNQPENLSRRIFTLFTCFLVYMFPIALVSLPFLAYSNDYWHMNVQYVADVPLQTQSWLVALAGLFGNENLFLRASSLLTLVAAALISLYAARRSMNVWLAATLIVLAFFLLSKKVVGYYYVMLLPFAIVALVPTKHFRLLALIVFSISLISLSPYFASWANQDHVWFYSALGIVNSVVWLGIFIWLWRNHPLAISFAQNAGTPVFISLALFFSAVAAALLQPFINSQASPIRAPMITIGFESQTVLVFLAFAFLVALALFAVTIFTRTLARAKPIPKRAYALVVSLAPLYFLTFTLTKESTAAFELFLKFIGQ